MSQATHRCQQNSRYRESTTLRALVLAALAGSLTGCWQEIRYEPGKTAQAIREKAAETAEEPLVAAPTPSTAELFAAGTPAESGSQPDEPTEVEVVPAPPAEELPDDPAESAVVEPAEETPTSDVATSVVDPSAAAVQPAPAENLATEPVEAEVPVSPAEVAPTRTALAAWEMSSKWSMAAALQAKGRDEDSFGDQLTEAKLSAALLAIPLPELPTHEADADRLTKNLAFLLEEAGPQLAEDLSEQLSAEHAALAELATKTHVLLLSYTPTSKRLDPVIDSIRQAAENSGLPDSVWRELVELLAERANFKRVKAAVFRLHQRAAEFLGGSEAS